VGKAVNKLDLKGRLILPAKMRPLLTGTLFLTRNKDGCLRIFTERMFQSEIDRQREMFSGGRSDRDSVRALIAATEECSLDNQGRLAIPPDLRTHADLEPEGLVVVSGMIDFVELWSEGRFAEIEARAAAP
jgi:MraZ protein